jgi:hypothetical protein
MLFVVIRWLLRALHALRFLRCKEPAATGWAAAAMAGVVQQGTPRCIPNRVSTTAGTGWALLSIGMRGGASRRLCDTHTDTRSTRRPPANGRLPDRLGDPPSRARREDRTGLVLGGKSDTTPTRVVTVSDGAGAAPCAQRSEGSPCLCGRGPHGPCMGSRTRRPPRPNQRHGKVCLCLAKSS